YERGRFRDWLRRRRVLEPRRGGIAGLHGTERPTHFEGGGVGGGLARRRGRGGRGGWMSRAAGGYDVCGLVDRTAVVHRRSSKIETVVLLRFRRSLGNGTRDIARGNPRSLLAVGAALPLFLHGLSSETSVREKGVLAHTFHGSTSGRRRR